MYINRHRMSNNFKISVNKQEEKEMLNCIYRQKLNPEKSKGEKSKGRCYFNTFG